MRSWRGDGGRWYRAARAFLAAADEVNDAVDAAFTRSTATSSDEQYGAGRPA